MPYYEVMASRYESIGARYELTKLLRHVNWALSLSTSNFLERLGEVRRIPIARTPVNKGIKEGPRLLDPGPVAY